MNNKNSQAGFDVTKLTFDEHGELVGLVEDELLAVVGGTTSGEAVNNGCDPNQGCA